MSWVLALVAVWVLVGVVGAVLIGRGIRLADERAGTRISHPDDRGRPRTHPAAVEHATPC